tara:strand:- start:2766 stop:2987 length:222 start_codon:yes stop_codon:yes gene_type:complete
MRPEIQSQRKVTVPACFVKPSLYHVGCLAKLARQHFLLRSEAYFFPLSSITRLHFPPSLPSHLLAVRAMKLWK